MNNHKSRQLFLLFVKLLALYLHNYSLFQIIAFPGLPWSTSYFTVFEGLLKYSNLPAAQKMPQ